jgi:hypothetical protein
LAPSLSPVVWPENFKAEHIKKYDESSNPEEFIEVYHTIIVAVGGDDRVKAKYLPTVLFGVRPDHDLSSYLKGLSTPGTSYMPCSLGTFSAHTSIHLLLRL